jgi:RNA polymerase sigma-70 factor (ECF subfamily)
MIVLEHSDLGAMTDHATAANALRGRLDGFFRGVERRALRMAQLAVNDLDDALELVQDSMLGFVRSYSAKPECDWAPLFWRVLDSRIQDHHRRQSVRRRWRVFFRVDSDQDENFDPLSEVADPAGCGPLESMHGSEAARAIDAALKALPDRQRQAFLLRVWEGLDVAATAVAMGCSEGSVKTHLFRAMDALKRRLEDHR